MNRSVCTPVSVMIIELIVMSTKIHPLKMSIRICPFRKKASTKIHCPRKVSIPILPFKSFTSFFYKSSYFQLREWFLTKLSEITHKVDKNSRFLDENWFWIENSSTVSAGVVGVEILWKLFWTRMCFQIRQAGQHAARQLCGLGLVINNTDISILCRCPSSSSEICRQFWRKKWFCLHKYDSKIVRINFSYELLDAYYNFQWFLGSPRLQASS